MTVLRYTKGDELEGIDITWPQPDGTPYNFSSGWTFIARIGSPNQAAVLQKTGPTGFTGAATFPNLVIAWATNDLAAIPQGSYHLDIKANLTATNQDVTRTWLFQILDGVLAPS
jgi:hypothetical protein